MSTLDFESIEAARRAAIEVLLHNARSGRSGLPRTAAWGYPEPYTRDLMIASLGICASGNRELIESQERCLTSLAECQSPLGLVPGLVDDPDDLGSSDTTPLFLIGLAAYQRTADRPRFLEDAAQRSLEWMEYQSPADRVIVAQLPTSDWRDEQWVLGYGLYVNALVYIYLRLFGYRDRADLLRIEMNQPVIDRGHIPQGVREGLRLKERPHYALWSYKVMSSDRFDLLGNSLAILGGVISRSRARSIVDWVEAECQDMRQWGDLAVDLPPVMFPFIRPDDPDWRERYLRYNRPGTYHNGGIWPFACGLYIAALVAVGRQELAEQKLAAFTELVRLSSRGELEFGFNEWIDSRSGRPGGQDWQLWSAAMYVYAAECVSQQATPLLDEVRGAAW